MVNLFFNNIIHYLILRSELNNTRIYGPDHSSSIYHIPARPYKVF